MYQDEANEEMKAALEPLRTVNSKRRNRKNQEVIGGGERRWSSSDNKFWGCNDTHDYLPSGLYKLGFSDSIGVFLNKQIIDTDELLVLPDSSSEKVVEEIDQFWSFKEKFQERGFIHKRGILLWGDPGSGKTATIQLIIQRLIEQGGIAVYVDDPGLAVNGLQMVRRIEPERPAVVILEDFEDLIHTYGESEYLALLDGESQISNVVFLATTNYPEKLEKRIIDRPSRFDTVKKIPMPTEDARRTYFANKEPSLTGEELENWVQLSEGLGISHLKEMIIGNRCYGTPIEEVVEKLHIMRKRDFSSQDALEEREKVTTGFQAPK